MYDCSCRPPNCVPASTGPVVGPGSYDTHLITAFQEQQPELPAPFLSWTARESNIPAETLNNARSYRPLEKWGKGKGSWFSKATSSRFQQAPRSGPGPNAYDIEGVVGKKMACSTSCKPADRPDFDPSEHAAMLVLTKIKYCLYNAVPSIPARGSVGYIEGSDGYLRKALPLQVVKEKPPDLAFSSTERSTASQLYKGPHWANRTESRLPFSAYPAPGPADYQPYMRPFQDLIHFPRETLYLPRYLDKLVCDKMKQSVPGPGAYDLMEQKVMRELPCLPPFNSSATRFGEVRSEGPGPGAYYNPKTRKTMNKKKSVLVERIPFGSTDERFKLQAQVQKPDPSAYTLRGFGDEMEVRVRPRFPPAPFGSCSVRFEGPSSFIQAQKIANPGPGMYETHERKIIPTAAKKSRSVFLSCKKSVSKVPKKLNRNAICELISPGARVHLYVPEPSAWLTSGPLAKTASTGSK